MTAEIIPMSKRLERKQFARMLASEGISLVADQNGAQYEIACSCGDTRRMRIGQAISQPDRIRRRFVEAGWETGRRPRCPQCIAKRKRGAQDEQPPAPQPEPEEAGDMSATTTKPDVQPTMREIALISVKLDSYFDAEKGVYLNGYSDQRIAEELDVAPAKVTRVREDCFGTLKFDPDVLALRSDLDALTELIDAAEHNTESTFANIRQQIEDLQRRLRKLEERRAA